MIYLDSCAIVKLVHVTPETPALRAWLTAQGGIPLVSSTLARVECARALRRVDPGALANLPLVLGAINFIAMDDGVCAAAAAQPEPLLRSLDAIHLATAQLLGTALTWFVTYDKRLLAAAVAAALPTAEPR
jgi:predicted nucleic acid-binding protein